MKGRARRPPVYGAPQPSRCVRTRVKVAVERQLGHVVGADTWWLPRPDTMVDCANAQHRVPTILHTANLARCKLERARRCSRLIERRRSYSNRNNGRQNLRRPIDGLFPE